MRLVITLGSDFSMNLIPNIAVPAGNYVNAATPAVPIGNTTWKPKAYRKLGLMTSAIPTTGLEIGEMYRTVCPQPYSSCQLSVKITPLSSGGLHNVSLFVPGLTSLLTLGAALEGPTDTDTEDNLHLG